MPRLELRSVLDRDTLDAILSLIDTATRMEGHRPVGEHKYSHLKLDATGWGGVLAWDGDHLVGYAHMRWNAREDVPRTAVEAVVHPDWYGSDVAERLLTEVRALVGRTGGGVLFVWVHHVQDSSTTLVARMGFAVLRAGLAYLRSRGCRQAILYVDLASAGAVALYESEGFRTQYAEVCYAEDVPALLSEEPRELRRPAE